MFLLHRGKFLQVAPVCRLLSWYLDVFDVHGENFGVFRKLWVWQLRFEQLDSLYLGFLLRHVQPSDRGEGSFGHEEHEVRRAGLKKVKSGQSRRAQLIQNVGRTG